MKEIINLMILNESNIQLILIPIIIQIMSQLPEDKQKFEWLQMQQNSSMNHPSKSRFSQNYRNIIEPTQAGLENMHKFFEEKEIFYSITSPCEPFSFEIEKIVPCFDFYRLYVKISRFKLIANVAKYSIFNILKERPFKKGEYADIYFSNLNEKVVCIKSFKLRPSIGFRKIFTAAVKEWSILKICSALECAPYVQNYLGFDILVYDDCIQFALQRGSPIDRLEGGQAAQLRAQLSRMHAFNIVHCDIKPENIVFSPHYGKPVFIDFGFSEIVAQPLGQKTLTAFKGTPNFCTPEMLSIILDESAYIDLYYNDAFGLKETLMYCQILSSKQCDQLKLMEEKYSLSQQLLSNPWFLMLSFQHNYIDKNEPRINQIYQKLIGKPENIKHILSFIKKGVNFVFLPTFFYQTLKPFQKLVQYRQIKEKIKMGLQIMHFQQQDRDADENRLGLKEILQSQQKENIETCSYDQYVKIILNITEIQKYFVPLLVSLILKCVRFDEKNLDFIFKVQIASKINPLMLLYLKQNRVKIKYELNINEQNLQLKEVKILIRLIFYYCLAQQPSKWIQQHIFDVFQQMVILNDDCYQLADPLLEFLSIYTQIFQPLLVALQLQRILQSTILMKLQLIPNHAQLSQKMAHFIQKKLKDFRKQNQHTIDIQKKAICTLLEMLKKDKYIDEQISLDDEEQLLKNIRNPRIRRQLFQHVLFCKMLLLNAAFMPSLIIKTIEYVKKSIDLYNLNFMCKTRIIINLMVISHNFDAIKAYQTYFSSVINCKEVNQYFDLYKFYKYQKMRSCDEYQMIDKLVKQLPFMKAPYYQIICTIWNYNPHNEQNEGRKQQFKLKLIQLYDVYERQKNRLKPTHKGGVQTFIDIYYQARIQFFFLRLLPTTQKAFLQSQQQYQAQLKQFYQDRSANKMKSQLYFKEIRVLFYRYYQSIHNNNQQIFFQSFKHIIQICEYVKLNQLIPQVINSANQVSCAWRNKKLVIYLALVFYRFCTINNDYSFYLIPTNKKCLSNSFHTFARQDKSIFRKLLIQLTQFLSKNPTHATKDYFLSLMVQIDKFIKKDPEYSYLLHYSNFMVLDQTHILQRNPNLLIFCSYSLLNANASQQLKLLKVFALNCEFLSKFAQKKLLQKYFIIVLSLLSHKNQRKKRFILKQAKNFIKSKKIKIKMFKIKRNNVFTSKLEEKMAIFQDL